jgi:hypothetical protein
MRPRVVLGVAGVAAAVLAVGIDLQLFDRYSTEVVDGHLSSRSYPELIALGALGPLVALALLAALAAMIAPPGGRGRMVWATCRALVAAGAVALVVGVGTAALMNFSIEAKPTVIALTTAGFGFVYACMLRSVRV